MPRIKAATILLSLATLSVPAFAQGTDPAVRDSSSSLNYVQGQATLDGQPVTTTTSSTPHTLHAGEVLTTTDGSADVTLVPGALLRIGQGTQVDLVSTDGKRAEVRIESGRANVAVNMLRPKSLLLVDLPNGQTQILKQGLYTFETANETVRVFNGEADVFRGASTDSNIKPVKLKEEHEITLNDDRTKPAKFDRMASQNELLPWTGAQEAHAAGDYGLPAHSGGNGDGGYAPVAYGYGPGSYALGYGYPGYGYGWDYPYAGYGYPYGFYGYPLGFGIGFGYGGYYRGGYYGHGYGGYRGGYGGYRGGLGSGYRGSVGAGRGFGGGGFHGGGGHR